MGNKLDQAENLLNEIVKIIQQAKGLKIISLNLSDIESAICKYFIICTGTSSTHVNSIENKIRKEISQNLGEKPYCIEGNSTGEWVLIDYYNIIVHVFQQKTREFYNIEDFWGDAKFKNY